MKATESPTTIFLLFQMIWVKRW